MQAGIALVIVAGAVFIATAAVAFPDGAPWGAANPAADEHCASCHFGAEPVRESEALVVRGLPPRPVPGEVYELEIRFDDPGVVIAGFQLLAHAPDRDAGTFTSADPESESAGAAIRSTAPASADGGVAWAIEWRAPIKITFPIVFHVAASAANDDGSPLGDTIHYRSYEMRDVP